MASSKAEFVSNAEASATPALLSGTAGRVVAASPPASASPLDATTPSSSQTRKSPRSRTSTFLSNTLLRPRGKSVSHPTLDDWARPVGGSEGLGTIYNSSMDSRERSQVLRSVTQLTKQSTNDLTGAAAEAFSGNATPSLSQPTRFFANWRTNSSNNFGNAEAPPTYQQDSQLEGRRRSEGSIISSTNSPRRESASSTQSSSRPSLQLSRTSFFSMGATSNASASTSATSASAMAFPRQLTCQQPQPQHQQLLQQRPSWSHRRRSTVQFSATARQALQSSRSFFGLPNGICEDHADALPKLAIGSSDSSKAIISQPGSAEQQQQQLHCTSQPIANEVAAVERGSKAAVLPSLINVDARNSNLIEIFLHSRQTLIPTLVGAGGGGGDGDLLKAGVAHAHADASAAGADASAAAAAAAAEGRAEVVVSSGNISHGSVASGFAGATANRFCCESGSGPPISKANSTLAHADTVLEARGKERNSFSTPPERDDVSAASMPLTSLSKSELQHRAKNETPAAAAAAAAADAHAASAALYWPASGASASAIPAAQPDQPSRPLSTSAVPPHASAASAPALEEDRISPRQSAIHGSTAPKLATEAQLLLPQPVFDHDPLFSGTESPSRAWQRQQQQQQRHQLTDPSSSTANPPLVNAPTAPRLPVSPDSSAILGLNDARIATAAIAAAAAGSSSSFPPSPVATFPAPSSSHAAPSLLDVGVALPLPSTPSSSNVVTPTLSSTPDTTGASTAVTTPSHSTSKLASLPHAPSPCPSSLHHDHSSPPALIGSRNVTHPASALQHAARPSIASLNEHLTANQDEPSTLSGGEEPIAAQSACATASASADDSRALPLTPPSSSDACRSPRSSVSGVSAHAIAGQQNQVLLPSPPVSSLAHSSSSASSSRRGSSNEPVVPLRRSSVVVESAPPHSPASPDPTSPTTSGRGRGSFDLRRISLFPGFSTTSKMSSKPNRASFAGLGNGQPPNAANADSVRFASSPNAGSSSNFFSRISLPGSSRRGSANDSPLSSPDAKPRSRFSSFAKIGRGGDSQTPTKDARSLRNSMQPWASASTDVLGMGPAQTQGRDSLALAREEATRPRKSLHLPRRNLIDLDSKDASDTTASTSTATHGPGMMALPPISTASIRADKPVSPSLQSARRPSLNFLRRSSATSNNSSTDNANSERRGSFARNFMSRTLSRSSKSDAQQEPAKATSTSNDKDEAPMFRSGLFASQAPVSAGNVAYPGMSSTVNWNASATAQSPSRAEIAPIDVGPMDATIPAYPGSSAAVDGTTPQPKNVTQLASGVLAQRRPSQGIDQEQDAVEATDSVGDMLVPTGTSSNTTASAAVATSNPLATRERSTRSSHALSHLPRLDSMRAIPNVSGNGQENNPNSAGTARTGSESTTTIETSDEEQEASDDDDEADLTGQTSDYHDLDDTETDDDTDYDGSPVASRRMSTAPMAATGSSGGLNRNRPTESLILPPAPSFIPNTSSPPGSQGFAATAAATAASSSTLSTSGTQVEGGGFSQNVGRDAWMSFSASGFTPFETPTPRLGGPTPRARQELSESSYFAARPGTSNSNRATTGGTMSGDAPPPSPSIISRSRAPSSASMRTIRTPGTNANGSGPVPNRSMPAPVGALPPLALHRQISKVGGDRSKSPARTIGSSRPSTSGTLTPQQAPAGEQSRSRAPSVDRPASERLDVRQGRPREVKAMPSPKVVTKPLVGLDGVSASSARPTFYQQKSKSLVDLLGPASRRLEIDPSSPIRPTINEPAGIETLRTPTTPRPLSEAPAYSKKDGLAPIDTSLAAPASMASPGGATLGRRRSMFEMRAEPPGYSIIHNRPEGLQIILPREEEGQEKLPTYYCGVHIEGYLPRKMEFSAPGVQAKDRSWKRQYFVLHGTSLRVYKNDLSVDRHAANGSWGEMKGVHVHLEPMNEDGSHGSGSGIGLGAAAREAISHTPLGAHRHDASKHKEAITQFDSKNGLVRNYTLQGAESGLAADYLKRRHVVRVRAEGEQFLLQTRSDRHVVDWIEALQAATNVSVDLEKRPMPKFITLPRRRRRRRRNADGAAASTEEQEARDLAEAQRRSMAEANNRGAEGSRSGGPGSISEATTRDSMSQRPSMSIENELNPSAAFERMLREDQEEGGRQSAAVM